MSLWLRGRSVSVFGLVWLREYHPSPGTTGSLLTHSWGNQPRGLPTSTKLIEGGYFRGFSLHDAASSNHVVPVWPSFSCLG
jgi:hypothetical protein